jgi:CRISPR-associated endonuclease Csn1
MKRWRLGLDVGTASVGAVAIDLDDDGKEVAVPWHQVRIFSEPNEKGQTGLTPKKAARRAARLARRQIDRRASRLRRIAHLAPLIGIDPRAVKPDGRKGQELPDIRARAAREPIELPDLLRVLLRMAKRRGYAGGFRAVKSEKELGVVQSGSQLLEHELAALAASQGAEKATLGEFLAKRRADGYPTRLKVAQEGVPDLFALRGTVEAEFDQIWAAQALHHNVLRSQVDGRPVREIFREAIFFQRPLKSPAASVGLCPLELHLPRAPRAQMAAQEFRIEKTIADLRWGSGRMAQALSWEQSRVIAAVLNDPEKLTAKGLVSFNNLYRHLEVAGCPRPAGRSLNLDRFSREELLGNTTLVAWKRLGLLAQWSELSAAHQVSVINLLADLGSPEQLEPDDWHQRFLRADARANDPNRFRRFAPAVVSFVDGLRNCDGYGRMTTMGFDAGRVAYSVKALRRLTDWLRDPSWSASPGKNARVDEEAAVRECYPNNGESSARGELTYPPKTGNDTVDVALSQVHWVVAQGIKAMGGHPAEIIVEFGREVGLGASRRNEWERLSAKNQRLRKAAHDEIVESGYPATNAAIRRVLLWKEQKTHCPYCDRPLGMSEVLEGSASHVEHIIPRSLTRVGQKRSEVVIAHASCNHAKGDQTPYQAFGHDEVRWRLIERRGAEFKAAKLFRKAKLLLLKDFEQEVMTDESIAEFADRQLHQTSWAARSAAQWLRCVCQNVFAARGEFTALLRCSWHLDTVIPEVRLANNRVVLDTDGSEVTKDEFREMRNSWDGHGKGVTRTLDKRIDHRHHVIDALVIGLASRSLYQKLARNYKENTEQMAAGAKYRRDWSVEPPLSNIRETAIGIVSSCNLSHKPDRHAAGAFFQDTAYGLKKQRHDEDGVLIVRKALMSLADEKSIERTRKNLRSIASDDVRDIVMAEFERRVGQGQSAKEALAEPVSHPLHKTGIRKVRVRYDDVSAKSAIEVGFSSRQGRHKKLLLSGGNAFLELSGVGNEARVRVVSLLEGSRPTGLEASTTIRRFYKGDTVIDSKDGEAFVVRQIKADGGGMLMLTSVVETRPVRDLSASDGLRKISGKGLQRLSLANVISSGSTAGGSA